jgi:hypothetical protein
MMLSALGYIAVGLFILVLIFVDYSLLATGNFFLFLSFVIIEIIGGISFISMWLNI